MVSSVLFMTDERKLKSKTVTISTCSL